MFCEPLRYVARNQWVAVKIASFRSVPSQRFHAQGGHSIGHRRRASKSLLPPLESDGWANPTGGLQCKNRAYRARQPSLAADLRKPGRMRVSADR